MQWTKVYWWDVLVVIDLAPMWVLTADCHSLPFVFNRMENLISKSGNLLLQSSAKTDPETLNGSKLLSLREKRCVFTFFFFKTDWPFICQDISGCYWFKDVLAMRTMQVSFGTENKLQCIVILRRFLLNLILCRPSVAKFEVGRICNIFISHYSKLVFRSLNMYKIYIFHTKLNFAGC